VVNGGRGADTIVLTDGSGTDRVFGGPGKDICYIDRGDRTRSCETRTVVG
jgi:Ca2+-binding RTX toxin-like protein